MELWWLVSTSKAQIAIQTLLLRGWVTKDRLSGVGENGVNGVNLEKA